MTDILMMESASPVPVSEPIASPAGAPSAAAQVNPPSDVLRGWGWRVAVWAAVGGGLGASLSYAIYLTDWHHEWLGFLLAIAWVIAWRYLVEPHIEARLSGHAHARNEKEAPADSSSIRRVLTQAVLAVTVVILVVVFEMFSHIVLNDVRHEVANFLMSLIGPASTIFFITLAWTRYVDSPRKAARTGALAGLTVSLATFLGFAIYLKLSNLPLPTGYLLNLVLPAAFFWALVGFVGGGNVGRRRPVFTITWQLLLLVTLWNVALVPYARIQGAGRGDVFFSVLLNFLRTLGWLCGLIFCPDSNLVLAAGGGRKV
jgi:hypothetical protein